MQRLVVSSLDEVVSSLDEVVFLLSWLPP
eukprot:COSAG06_NODE_35903_length_454_cov_0.802817_2_plen_28_part_01